MSNTCEVLATDDFRDWYYELDNTDADKVFQIIGMLEAAGVSLKFPYSSNIEGSKYPLRELRVQSKGQPLRILYAFNPKRNALLILGGDKGGNDCWYDVNVPLAEKLWEKHLEELT
jgi:hypothetical protein